MGRPTEYTPELGAEICALLSDGKNLIDIREMEGMPHPGSIWKWREAFPEFDAAYARARLAQAEVLASEVVALSDRARIGEKIEVKTEGEAEVVQAVRADQIGQEIRVKTQNGPLAITVTDDMVGQQVTMLMGVPQITTKVMTADMVDRAKLQVDARKWYAARMAPHVFGDRLAHQMLDEHGKPAAMEIRVTRVGRKASGTEGEGA